MDYNYLSLFALLPPGRYDVYKNRFETNRVRVIVNYACAVISIFCGLKNAIIVAVPRDRNAILYLAEIYIYDSPVATLFQLGSFMIHLATSNAYYCWATKMSRDKSKMEGLKFLFIPNLKDLCKWYDLEAGETKKFLRRADYIRYLVYLLMWSFEGFYGVFVTRGLVISYSEIELKYFFAFAVPFYVITLFSYHCLITGILTMYIFLFTTQAFLKLRAAAVARKIRLFHRVRKRDRERVKLRIARTLDDIVRQFHSTNILFDDLISPIYVNCLVCALLFPNFFFEVESIPPIIFVIVCLMYCGGMTVAFSLTVFNDEFIKKLKRLADGIHQAMPTFTDPQLKLWLNNYLILNNEHKVLSYEYFRSYDYSSWDLVEYMAHSLSFVFLVAPLIPNAKN